MISDTRVYVVRNTLINLSKILLGSAEYALTRVPQSAGFKVAPIDGLPDVDYYTITGGLPAGDWDDVRFETATGTFIPASVDVTQGLYSLRNDDWQRAGFYAPAVNPNKDFKFMVEEVTQGAKTDKNLALASSGSNFTIVNPFPDILRITFNADSAETDLLNRYSVYVPLREGDDTKHPIKLEVGSQQWPLSYYETDAQQAIYRTIPLVSADRAKHTLSLIHI